MRFHPAPLCFGQRVKSATQAAMISHYIKNPLRVIVMTGNRRRFYAIVRVKRVMRIVVKCAPLIGFLVPLVCKQFSLRP